MKEQLSWRPSDEERDALEAIAFLRGSTPTDVARNLVSDFIRTQLERQRVRDAIRLRAEESAESSGVLTDLTQGSTARKRGSRSSAQD